MSALAAWLPVVAAIGEPGSYWNAPGHVTGIQLVIVGLIGIGFGLYLKRVTRRFNVAIIGLLIISAGLTVWGVANLL